MLIHFVLFPTGRGELLAKSYLSLAVSLWRILSSVLQMSLSFYFLWQELGYSILVGIGFLLLLMPVNALIMAKKQSYETKEMQEKDTRVKQLTEVLSGIKILKLFAWELPFQEKINDIRRRELHFTGISCYIQGAIVVLWRWTPTAVVFLIFMTYVSTDAGHVLTAQKAFVSLSLLNILRFSMNNLPQGIGLLINVSR